MKNYNKILKDIDKLQFEYETYKNIEADEITESITFSPSSEEKVESGNISDKTSKIVMIYNEVTKRINKVDKRFMK